LCWPAGCSPWRDPGTGDGEAPVTGVPAPRVRHWSYQLAQKTEGPRGFSPKVWSRVVLPCRGVGGADRRRGRRGACQNRCCRDASGLLIRQEGLCGSCGGVQGLGQPEPHWRRGIAAAEELTGEGVRAKFRRVQAGGRGKRAQDRSWSWDGASAAALAGCGVVERRVYGGAGDLLRRRGCGGGSRARECWLWRG
jgi:hypothetical protein